MRALITNDDGIDSPGVRFVARVAVAAGLDVTVAAPDGERSGTSAMMSALEAGGRLLAEERKLDGLENVPTLAVRAPPAMIAFVAVHGGFGGRPDIVLAGINRGPNLGRAILHSGTVGATLTAASAGVGGLAFSLGRVAPGPGLVPAPGRSRGGGQPERAGPAAGPGARAAGGPAGQLRVGQGDR